MFLDWWWNHIINWNRKCWCDKCAVFVPHIYQQLLQLLSGPDNRATCKPTVLLTVFCLSHSYIVHPEVIWLLRSKISYLPICKWTATYIHSFQLNNPQINALQLWRASNFIWINFTSKIVDRVKYEWYVVIWFILQAHSSYFSNLILMFIECSFIWCSLFTPSSFDLSICFFSLFQLILFNCSKCSFVCANVILNGNE